MNKHSLTCCESWLTEGICWSDFYREHIFWKGWNGVGRVGLCGLQCHMLTKIMPINMAVDPTITSLLWHLIQDQTPAQVPAISPPKRVAINRTAPEQSYATSASTPVDWNNSQASFAELLKLFPLVAIWINDAISCHIYWQLKQ